MCRGTTLLVISKYFATLVLAVFLVTFGGSSLPFVTRSQVLSGRAMVETSQFEFTIDADNSSTYKVSSRIKQFLESHIRFCTEGIVRLVSTKVEIAPKRVSWTEHRSTITAAGAAMTARIKWDTPAGSANGAHGDIYIELPAIPWLEGHVPYLRSGAYQVEKKGRYVVREVTTYRGAFLLSLSRFQFALAAGLPFGTLFQAIFWAFVLRGEKRSRLAESSAQGSGLPRTFYPSVLAVWIAPLIIICSGALMASVMAGFSAYEGFLSSSLSTVIYIMLATVGGVALLVGYFTTKALVTVRVEANGISYSRGRGHSQR